MMHPARARVVSCWGILHAPASGLAMAELIVAGQAQSVDPAPFAVQRATAVSR